MKSIEEINEMNEILTLSVEVEAGDVDVADAGEDVSLLLGVVLDDAVAAGDVPTASFIRGGGRWSEISFVTW
jgi:hypothetical protein